MKLARDHPIQCRCGRFKGSLAAGAKFSRAVCYCRDCQAYAAALGDPALVLDAKGGTDLVASLQGSVRFTAGMAQLACLSLSERGLLRWYASCCGTPVANMARDARLSYVGLVHSCLGRDARALDAVFGPPELVINVESATGHVPSAGLRIVPATLRIIGRIVGARLSGSWKKSPFFDGNRRPVADARVVRA